MDTGSPTVYKSLLGPVPEFLTSACTPKERYIALTLPIKIMLFWGGYKAYSKLPSIAWEDRPPYLPFVYLLHWTNIICKSISPGEDTEY